MRQSPVLDALDAAACALPTSLSDPLVSAGGVHQPFSFQHFTPIRPPGTDLLALSAERAWWLSISADGITTAEALSYDGANFITAEPTDAGGLLLISSPPHELPAWVEVSKGGERVRRGNVAGARRVFDAIRHGGSTYALVSDETGPMLAVYNMRTLGLSRLVPLLSDRSGVPHALAVGSSAVFALIERVAAESKDGTQCDLLVLERHSYRSIRLLRGVGARCGAIAPYGPDLVVLDGVDGTLRRYRFAELVQRPRSGAPSEGVEPEVLWRCPSPCQADGLVIDRERAIVSVRRSNAQGGTTAEVGLVDLSPAGSTLWLAAPSSVSTARRLYAPSYLARHVPVLLSLQQKVRAMQLYSNLIWYRGAGRPSRRSGFRRSSQGADPRSVGRELQELPPREQLQPYSMLGSVDIEPLRTALLRDWEYLWGEDRQTATQSFGFLFPGLQKIAKKFPGVLNAKLLFSGSFVGAAGSELPPNVLPKLSPVIGASAETCLVFPAWRRYAAQVVPLLEEVLHHKLGLRNLSRHLWRVQINRMPPNSTIMQHQDNGIYAELSHRVHIPLVVPRCIRFEQHSVEDLSSPTLSAKPSWREVPMKESEAFEVNNKIVHRVHQTGPYERLTLLIDVAERPCARYVEVSPSCSSWEDPSCVIDFHVDEREWLPPDFRI